MSSFLFFVHAYNLYKNNWYLWLLALLWLGISSCSDGPYYQKTYDFHQRTWASDRPSVFRINIDDTTAVYRFELSVRTTTEYAYNNLWLLWKSKTPSNERASEPFELKITSPEGNWIGKKTGSLVEHQLTFAERKMPHVGEYIFTIQQASTHEKVKDILDIGLTVYKTHADSDDQRKNLNTDPKIVNDKKNKKQ